MPVPSCSPSFFIFYSYAPPLDLPSFPTRRSSDLSCPLVAVPVCVRDETSCYLLPLRSSPSCCGTTILYLWTLPVLLQSHSILKTYPARSARFPHALRCEVRKRRTRLPPALH